ncbi:hypothetical protein FVO59_03030 [Microbacterium esteraromaticum]|uniref:Uncharacterized protein n=1 Tax=Microbacterium esteraromaticum TaxID=57043 RepID=A0A7D7WFN2_9MICO|nr:hypothetical protein [Microbacterium esteraromaticum]QMU96294.1 hypothetical protein FVO59_03030 [Microbacterium esteraromaticum]
MTAASSSAELLDAPPAGGQPTAHFAENGAEYGPSVAEHETGNKSRNPVKQLSEHSSDLAADSTPPPTDQDFSVHARAGEPLGPPRFGLTGFSSGIAIPEENPGSETTPVATPATPVGRGFLVVTSSREEIEGARAFFKEWKDKETGGQKAHARERSTVFSLMQYRRHPETGAVIWTQEQFDKLIAALDRDEILDRAAAIWQDSDTDDEGTPVPVHMHAAIKLKAGAEKSIRWISDRAEMPASRIQTPKELRAAEGKSVEFGPMAAERAFWDFCSYLTHEHKGGA